MRQHNPGICKVVLMTIHLVIGKNIAVILTHP